MALLERGSFKPLIRRHLPARFQKNPAAVADYPVKACRAQRWAFCGCVCSAGLECSGCDWMLLTIADKDRCWSALFGLEATGKRPVLVPTDRTPCPLRKAALDMLVLWGRPTSGRSARCAFLLRGEHPMGSLNGAPCSSEPGNIISFCTRRKYHIMNQNKIYV
jgi:hypothetical protein